MKAQALALPFLLLATVFPALPASAESDIRTAMNEASGREIRSLERTEVPGDSLGEWKEVIDSTLFMLFRRTELSRGPLRVLVTARTEVISRLYPDGTFVLSTGLLDYIDSVIFETASVSGRRMRNPNAERERLLVPFLVPEASRFALDQSYAAWNRTVGSAGAALAGNAPWNSMRQSTDEILEADRFSFILLALAGYDASVLDSWFETLRGLYPSGAGKPVRDEFVPYLEALPSPDRRIESVGANRTNLSRISGELAGVLFSLRSGIALKDAEASLAALRELYPDSPYILRLDAMVCHRLFLATIPAERQQLVTLFPVAVENDTPLPEFRLLLDGPQPPFPAPSGIAAGTAGMIPAAALASGTEPASEKYLARATAGYRASLAAYPDPAISSCLALLLIQSGKTGLRNEAVELASDAASLEGGSTSFIARANFASVLYLTGTDFVQAQYLAQSLLPGTVRALSSDTALVSPGMAGDNRAVLLNLALMLRALGDTEQALQLGNRLDALLVTVPGEVIEYRQVRPGDTVDELLARWGRPAEIIYNYYKENWTYPSLAASVLVEPDRSAVPVRSVRLIRLGDGSPVSPGSDLRTGDTRESFESVFGKPSYEAGDSEVYLVKGNRLAVFYLAGRIRSLNGGR